MGEEFKRITIKVPIDLWKLVRRSQEEGRVKSFQEAAITGLTILLVTQLEVMRDEGLSSTYRSGSEEDSGLVE